MTTLTDLPGLGHAGRCNTWRTLGHPPDRTALLLAILFIPSSVCLFICLPNWQAYPYPALWHAPCRCSPVLDTPGIFRCLYPPNLLATVMQGASLEAAE